MNAETTQSSALKTSSNKEKYRLLDSIPLIDFHGGVHPAENKQPAASEELQFAGVPEVLFIQLPVTNIDLELHCKIGDKVLKGQILASDKENRQPPVHAPTSALVKQIVKIPSPHPSGVSVLMLELHQDGKDCWVDRHTIDFNAVLATKPEVLIDKIFSAGITGMGGAGFPTATKLNMANSIKPPNNQSKLLLLNGAECEPFISCDDKLMQTQPEKILKGAQLLAHCIGAEKIQIVVEDNKTDALQALRDAREAMQLEIGIITIPTKYPSGGEKQLIEIVTGKQVPKEKFPAHMGITVQNLATTTAVYDALVEDTPLIERLVTVTGKSLKLRANYRVLLGTPVAYLLKQAGFDPLQHSQIIMGGPMMGHNLSSLKTPIVKTTNCIIAPSETELPKAPDALACIRCGLCTEVCPAELLPQQLYWHSRAEELNKLERLNLFDCIECGACSFVCPSHIPLVEYYRFAKTALRNKQAEKIQIEAARLRHDKRQLRLDRLQQEKALRRKQRAEEAQRRKQQRLEEDGLSEEVKAQSVADAVARVKARKLEKAAQQTTANDIQNNSKDDS